MVEGIEASSAVHLELDSNPESVALVRAMLAGVAELRGFERELLDDLNTTVSEACNNVVKHAYPTGDGPLVVHLDADEDCVEVTIRDHGVGLDHGTPSDDHIGVGLALIRALADRAEFVTEPEQGTEVRVAFNRGARQSRSGGWREEAPDAQTLRLNLPGDVIGTLAPVNLLSGVVGRMARLLAARNRFSLERFSDLYLLFDQLAFHAARQASSPRMTFALSSEAKRLKLEIGPLAKPVEGRSPAGAAEPPDDLRILTDEVTVEPVADELVLRVVVGSTE